MSLFPREPAPPIFWVVESRTRWRDGARRFIGPFQHRLQQETTDAGTEPVLVRSIEASKIRAAVATDERAAILWEVTAENAAAVSLVIAQIGVSQNPPLQLAAIEGKTPRGLEVRLMELGVRGVVHRTEQLAALAPLVHRFFKAASSASH